VALAVGKRTLLGRELASAVRLSAPIYWAGRGAYQLVRDQSRSGREMIQRAVAGATAGGLAGELLDIHRIAARFLPDSEAAQHAAAATALEARFRAQRPPGS
jgi:hypothetical protein